MISELSLEERLRESVNGLLQGFCSINNISKDEEERIIALAMETISEEIRGGSSDGDE